MTWEETIEKQRRFFAGGTTRKGTFRRRALERLRREILCREEEIFRALEADLGKSPVEAYAAEISQVLEEIRCQEKGLERWSRPRPVAASLAQQPGIGWRVPEPLGCVLVLSPWNYPFQLALCPAVAAIAAGNCVTIKPSRKSPATSWLLKELVEACFEPWYVQVLPTGEEINSRVLECRFDHIFFTGGAAAGRRVMAAAARFLTPVTLELGGKSPCLVDETADLPMAARRIAWGKWLNAGQTCVAPDYVLVQASVKDRLVEELKKAIRRQYTAFPCANSQYPRIVNQAQFDRLQGLLEGQRLLFDGGEEAGLLKMGPKLVDSPSWDSPLMKEEIFGPILPILPYRQLDQAIRWVRERPKPLALYLFTRSRAHQRQVWRKLSFGGGCVNDTVIQLASPRLPFGGVGESGMGAYHGRAGFDAFTHYKSILWKPAGWEIPLRYPPYSGRQLAVIRAVYEGRDRAAR